MRLYVLLIASVSVCGCQGKGREGTHQSSTKPKPAKPSLKIISTSSQTYDPSCRGEFCPDRTYLKLDEKAGVLEVRADAPPGQKTTVAGKPLGNAIALEPLATQVPLGDAFGTRSWKTYLDLPVMLEGDGTKEGVLGISLNAFTRVIAKMVKGVETKPIRFDDKDTQQPEKPRSLLWGERRFYVGKPGTLRELDLVAVSKERTPRVIGRCGPYQSKTGPITAVHQAIDLEVAVYERRTGKKFADKVFVAPRRPCPKAVMVAGKRFGGESGLFVQTEGAKTRVLPPTEEIQKWLATLVPKG